MGMMLAEKPRAKGRVMMGRYGAQTIDRRLAIGGGLAALVLG